MSNTGTQRKFSEIEEKIKKPYMSDSTTERIIFDIRSLKKKSLVMVICNNIHSWVKILSP